jgi:hypothetical protein
MSEWAEGFSELRRLCVQFSYYPKLFPVLAYLNYFVMGNKRESDYWKDIINQQSSVSSVKQCAKYMKLPERWSGENGRRIFMKLVDEDIG